MLLNAQSLICRYIHCILEGCGKKNIVWECTSRAVRCCVVSLTCRCGVVSCRRARAAADARHPVTPLLNGDPSYPCHRPMPDNPIHSPILQLMTNIKVHSKITPFKKYYINKLIISDYITEGFHFNQINSQCCKNWLSIRNLDKKTFFFICNLYGKTWNLNNKYL